MIENSIIQLKAWNREKGCDEETGETINVYSLAQSISLGNIAALLEEFLNLGGKRFREGKEIGYPPSDYFSLPGARTCNDQQWTACIYYCVTLLGR